MHDYRKVLHHLNIVTLNILKTNEIETIKYEFFKGVRKQPL